MVGIIILTLAILVYPSSNLPLASHPGFMPAFGTLILMSDGLTASLLLVQAQLTRDRQGLRLGAAYLFSAMTIVPHLLAFPGVLAAAPVIGGPSSAVWLWCIWHGGFPAAIIWFALCHPGRIGRFGMLRTVAGVCLAVVSLATLATVGVSLLPVLITSGHYNQLNALGIGPAILGVTITAEILVVTRLRFRDVMATWLSVALLAAILDVSLTLVGGGRFTLGWYTARALSLMTGLAVFFALISELMREAGRVAEVNGQLEHLLRTDVLTHVANRRAFDIALDAEWRRASREQTALSLLMIDIDWFKGFNDRYGHPAGDRCLKTVAAALAGQSQRPADLAARLGGEEFAVLLPLTDKTGAYQVAERVRAAVADVNIPHEASGFGKLTVSIGVATAYPFDAQDGPARLVSSADQALYAAKAAGRNTTSIHTEPEPAPWDHLADVLKGVGDNQAASHSASAPDAPRVFGSTILRPAGISPPGPGSLRAAAP